MTEPFIIDVHTHLGVTREFRAHFGSTEDFIRLMDVVHTEVSIFSPMGALSAQFEAGYADAVRALERYPDRLQAYTVFDPNWPELSLRLVQKYLNHPGFVGIKIHPDRHATPPDDPRYTDLWLLADERRLVVLTHTWSPDPAKPTQNFSVPERFVPILESHSHIKLILGHTGGRDIGERQAIRLLKRFPNCWADLSGDNFTQGRIERLVQEVGAARILYGTDSNWIDPRYQWGHLLSAKISAEDRLRIFRTNALEVFGESDLGSPP